MDRNINPAPCPGMYHHVMIKSIPNLKTPVSISPAFTVQKIGWLLTISFIAMTFVPRSFDNTLFVDGLAYASIARNMAMGEGSFWQPYFAESFWLTFNDRCAFFCEHPPLMFGMQSLLFRVFADSSRVENIYNLIVLAASIVLIVKIWRCLFKHNLLGKELEWLPVLFWYGMRIVWWSVPNNLLDTTMAVFCLWSCYFQLRAFSTKKGRVLYWILSGLMVFLACLTKGPVGLFPLAFPVLYLISYGKIVLMKSLEGTGLVLVTFLFLSTILLTYEPARFFLTNYFQGQVVLALMKKREKISNDWTAHFYMVRLLIINVVPHILILAGLYLTSLRLNIEVRLSGQAKKTCLLLFLVSVSVVLPMLASVKQADYYLMPALPFVALLFAALAMEMLSKVLERMVLLRNLFMSVLSVVFLLLMCFQTIYPSPDYMFEITSTISRHVPQKSKIYLPRRIAMFSEIHTPFQRYTKLSIAYDPHHTKYLFFDNSKDEVLDSVIKAKSHKIIALGYNAVLAIRK